MKRLYLLSLLLSLFSCTVKQTDGEEGVEVISVENVIANDMFFLEFIEVIPLETNDSVLMFVRDLCLTLLFGENDIEDTSVRFFG